MNQKRYNILILIPFMPYPASDGGSICIFSFIDNLRTIHNFTLLIPIRYKHELDNCELLKRLWPQVSIRPVDLREQHQKNTTPSLTDRIKSKVINLFKLLPTKEYQNTPKPSILDDLDFVFPFKPLDKRYIDALEEVCKAKFDIIQITLTKMLNIIDILPKESKIIFEEMESKFNVLSDYLETQEDIGIYYRKYMIGNCEEMSNYYISKVDAVFTLNEKDEKYFKDKFPKLKIFNSPFGVLDKDITKQVTKEIPNKIVFSGNEGHFPNYDAIIWYLEEIFPHVKKLVNIDLYITGNWSAKTVEDLSSKFSNLKFVGFVDDYSQFLKNSIMIVPIRLGGGGIRTKILYAMGNSVPVVSTTIGAFGIKAENNTDIYIADKPLEIAEYISNLVKSPDAYAKLAENGYNLIVNSYSQTATSMRRNAFYERIMN